MKQGLVKMRRWFTAALVPSLVLSFIPALVAPLVIPARPAHAADSDIEQVYIQATIARGTHTMSRPQALVRVGANAAMSIGRASADGPRFGLRYLVEQPADAA